MCSRSADDYCYNPRIYTWNDLYASFPEYRFRKEWQIFWEQRGETPADVAGMAKAYEQYLSNPTRYDNHTSSYEEYVMWSAYVFVEVYLGEHLMVGEEVYFRRYTELQAYIQECNGNVSDDVWNLLASLGIGMADSQMDASNPLLGPDGLGGGGGSNRRPDYSIGHKGDGKILQREGVTEGELLVYGPSSDGKLNELAHDLGGKTLNDLKGGPSMSGYSDWGEYSKAVLKETPSRKVRVYFDLTNMKDIKGVLNNMGEFKDSVTAQELRYIRDNWSFFEDNVEFYKDGIRRSLPPWIE